MTPEQEQKINQLNSLKADGTLTEEEYNKARNRILAPNPLPTPAATPTQTASETKPKKGFPPLLSATLVVVGLIVLINVIVNLTKSDNEPKAAATLTEEQMRSDSITAAAFPSKEKLKERAAAKEKAVATVKLIRPLLAYRKDDFAGGYFHGRSEPKFVNANGIFAYFSYKDDTEGPGPLRFSVQYHSDDWLFIKLYRFLIDGKEYLFIPDRISEDSGNGGKIWEWFDEPVTAQSQEIIDAIIKSKTAKVRIVGRDYYDDKVITPAQKADFKRIVELHQALEVIQNS